MCACVDKHMGQYVWLKLKVPMWFFITTCLAIKKVLFSPNAACWFHGEEEKRFSRPPPVLVTAPSLYALFSNIFQGNHRTAQTAAWLPARVWVFLCSGMCDKCAQFVTVFDAFSLRVHVHVRMCMCVCVWAWNKQSYESQLNKASQWTCLTLLWSFTCRFAILLVDIIKLQQHQVKYNLCMRCNEAGVSLLKNRDHLSTIS